MPMRFGAEHGGQIDTITRVGRLVGMTRTILIYSSECLYATDSLLQL